MKDSQEVLSAFTFLRSQAKDWRTDYFLSPEELEEKLQAGKVRAVLSRTAFLLIETRTSYERLYYGSTCAGALTELLRSALPGSTLPLVVDLIADKDEGGRVQLVDGFTHCGFQQQFRLRRMTRIQKRLQDLAVPADKFARPSETDEITRLLQRNFDVMTENVPSCEEIRAAIQRREIFAARRDGRVVAVFWLARHGKRGEARYWLADPAYRGHGDFPGVAVYWDALRLMKGLRVVTLFVKEENATVIKMHLANGFRFDGLEDMVFTKKGMAEDDERKD